MREKSSFKGVQQGGGGGARGEKRGGGGEVMTLSHNDNRLRVSHPSKVFIVAHIYITSKSVISCLHDL